MPHDPRKSLEDMRRAASLIAKFADGKSIVDYVSDDLLHAAIEREFTIVGEALNRLGKEAPEVADQIPERRQIIAFRNILVHGYDAIDDNVVWDVIEHHLPVLMAKVQELLAN